ncbi:hypothetical protein FP2506_01210 [Fulvimarina pelagi HTCC2506]|uniref:Uncharacterized protein n=1 Tax=Fulvimarina pelagi HTCC2506 TaxID=314231 RepID=Q0G255_9HYPH|nr:hypothetical protein FP2506_01210 [Fulvimarina pelagi HTCC2506]
MGDELDNADIESLNRSGSRTSNTRVALETEEQTEAVSRSSRVLPMRCRS